MQGEVEKGVAFLQTIIKQSAEFLVAYSFDILGAILVLVAGSIATIMDGQRSLRLEQLQPGAKATVEYVKQADQHVAQAIRVASEEQASGEAMREAQPPEDRSAP